MDNGNASGASLIKRALKTIDLLDTELRALKIAANEPLAVVGMGCRLPGGANTPAAYWELLLNKRNAITEIPDDRWDRSAVYDPDPNAMGKMYNTRAGFIDAVDQFDAAFFNISPVEAIMMDPQQRLTLEAAWHALEDACIAPDSLFKTLTGVFIGMGQNDYAYLTTQQAGIYNVNAYYGLGNGHCFTAGRISHLLGLHGPSLALDTACSSSLLAIHLACQSLRNRECDVALAGGVQLMLSPLMSVYLSRTRALSPTGYCRPFSADADGFVRAEGVGVIVLKRLSDALQQGDRILSVIKGSAVNHDGSSSGITVPNGLAQEQLLRTALDAAGLHPAEIAYIEAHGTGTRLGDPIELGALDAVYGQQRGSSSPLWVGAAKSNIGHLEAAAGVAGLIKTSLLLQHRLVPANLHFTAPNPQFDWNASPLRVPLENITLQPEAETVMGGVSAFGLSGTNVHTILSSAPAVSLPERVDMQWQLITLSAKEEAMLLQKIADLHLHLQQYPGAALADIAYSANAGRQHFKYRVAWVVKDAGRLADRLAAIGSVAGIREHNNRLLLQQAGIAAIQPLLNGQAPLVALPAPDLEKALTALAAAYIQGHSINWVGLYKGAHYRKTSLPLMPFNRQRYWVDMLYANRNVISRQAEEEKAIQLQMQAHLYDHTWEQQDLPAHNAAIPAGKWLLFIDTPEEKEQWRTWLGRQEDIRFVSFTGEWSLKEDTCTMHPLDTAQWDRLREHTPADYNIIYASRLVAYASLPAPELATAHINTLLLLTQAFHGKSAGLYVMTRSAINTHAPEPVHGWQQAGMIGCCKSLSLEHPGWLKGVLDLDRVEPNNDLTETIQRFLCGMEEPLMAYHAGSWWAPRIKPVKAPEGQAPELQGDAAYLVTGGTGHLGLKAVKWLADNGAKNIFVASRSGSWNSSGRLLVEVLKQHAVSVQLIQADISEQAAVNTLLDTIATHTGSRRIAGVIHAAGTSGFAEMGTITPAMVTAMAAPKINGAWWLYQALAKEPPGFFIAFSSIAAAWGSRGQTHYAAVNQCMEALLQHWRHTGCNAVSIAWGPWQGGGMTSAEHAALLKKIGILSFLPQQALDIPAMVVQGRCRQPLLVHADWSVFCSLYAVHGNLRLFEAIPVKAAPQIKPDAGGALLQQIMGTTTGTSHEALQQFLVTQVAGILAYPPERSPDKRQGFFEMGMDSIMALQLKENIASQLGITLPVTDIFQYHTIEQLCAYLQQTLDGGSTAHATAPGAAVSQRPALSLMKGRPVDRLLEQMESQIKILKQYAS